jgi:hypothetical protein
MRPLRLILDFLSYDGTLTNDPADAIKIKNTIEESSVSEVSRQQLTLVDQTIDQEIILPSSSCDYLLILVDRQVNIKLNGGADELTLRPRANGKKTLAFSYRGEITSLAVTNSSGADAKIDILAVKV